MAQTAVEWLVKKFEECELMYGTIQSLIHKQYLDGIIKQAKQMEKEQISQGYMSGLIDAMNQQPKEYYNETYGKE